MEERIKKYIVVDGKTMAREAAILYYEVLKENVDHLIALSDNNYTTKKRKDYIQDLKNRLELYRIALEGETIIDLVETKKSIYTIIIR